MPTIPPMNTAIVSVHSLPSSSTSTTIAIPSAAPVVTTATPVWSPTVIIGVILAVFAILVGIPSAVVATKKLRVRRQASLNHNDNGTALDETNDSPRHRYAGTDVESNDGHVTLPSLSLPEPAYVRTSSNINTLGEVAILPASHSELPTTTDHTVQIATAPGRAMESR